MNLVQALAWLDSFQGCSSPFGLGRITAILESLGHPERQFPSVLVAGTNGKGSVTAMLEAIFAAGETYQVGATISPHLFSVLDRVRLGGRNIDEALFIRCVEALHDPVDALEEQADELGAASFFELTTALAFWAFAESEIDLAIVEIGLGGRLDATNVVVPEVAVITNIGTDHTEMLGQTRMAIAGEKLGILKKKGLLVTAETDPQILALFEARCAELKGKMTRASLPAWCRVLESTARGHRLAIDDAGEVEMAMPGEHQLQNLACALTALEQLRKNGFDVAPAAVAAGLAKVRWPARLQWLTGPGGLPLLVDGAHNAEGVGALTSYLQRFPLPRPCHLVFGALQGKPVAEMAAALAQHADSLVFVPPPTPRSLTEPEFRRMLATVDPRWRWSESLTEAMNAPAGTASCLLTGSLYLAAEYLRAHEQI